MRMMSCSPLETMNCFPVDDELLERRCLKTRHSKRRSLKRRHSRRSLKTGYLKRNLLKPRC
jgi:hypothetical protein